jgi:hypothetical protein
MKKRNVTICCPEIKETETFKGLSKMVQSITLKPNVVKNIQHGVNVSINIGFDQWKKQTAFNNTTQQIVKELVELKSLK